MADADILTLAEAQRALNLSEARVPSNVDEIEAWVSAVSQRIDDLYGAVVYRTVTDEVHYDADGYGLIVPRVQPIVSVTTVTEYVSGTGTVLTAGDFDTVGTYRLVHDADLHRIERRSGWLGDRFRGAVKLTYVAGRYATTEDVEAKWKQAAKGVLAGMATKYFGAWARGGDAFADPVFFDEVDAVLTRWLGARTPVIA